MFYLPFLIASLLASKPKVPQLQINTVFLFLRLPSRFHRFSGAKSSSKSAKIDINFNYSVISLPRHPPTCFSVFNTCFEPESNVFK
ncbi:hypothetical protein B9Z55_004099 [Caenorhabditis nigoni]|uniref:Uncharacterized protein n=1 Tax=Caenorhabditis nigoni TaxID=1611254 RepID=A0A2G5UUT3_9PELO|nr:hypothetical protein B9Z55_004099 [Caenorhabditis nigoni]